MKSNKLAVEAEGTQSELKSVHQVINWLAGVRYSRELNGSDLEKFSDHTLSLVHSLCVKNIEWNNDRFSRFYPSGGRSIHTNDTLTLIKDIVEKTLAERILLG